MSATDGKLDRLSAGLSARERMVLLARAMLADGRPDPSIRGTMPPSQGPEFNHFVALANGILHALLPVALTLAEEVRVLEHKAILLDVLVAWGFERGHLAFDASLLAHVPIAQSEYEARLQETRHEYWPLRDAAEWVADERELPAKEAAAVLRAAAGEITSRRRGRGIEFEVGALCDWLGIPTPCGPDWGTTYEVVPDEEMSLQAAKVRAVAAFERLSDTGPPWPTRVLPALADAVGIGHLPEDPPTPTGRLMSVLAEQLGSGIPERWSRVTALELVVAEVVREFEDDSVLPEALTVALADAHSGLLKLAQQAPPNVGKIVLPEPDETYLGLYRKALHRDDNRVST